MLGSRRYKGLARYTESVCRLCRREGHEAVPQGGPLFQGQVRHRAAQLPARPARPPALQAARLRHPASREAEGQADLRSAREPVPAGVRPGRAAARASRARTCSRSSSAGWTTSCTRSASRPRARRRASSCATATSTINGKKVSIPSYRVARARSSRSRRRAGRTSRSRPRRDGAGARRSGLARSDAGVLLRHGRRAAEARRHQPSDPGAADRRAVLQVVESRRGTPRIPKSEENRP